MAAPNTVYLDGGATRVPIHIEGEIKLDAYPALKLAEYGNTIKDLFYIDAWIMVDDGLGKSGFVGIVKDIPDSQNYKMHAAPRVFKARLEDANGQRFIVMNDSGLNTLPYVGVPSVGEPDTTGTNGQDNFAGQVFLSVNYRSSYYTITNDYGFYLSVNNGDFTKHPISSLPAKQQILYNGATSIPELKFGDYGVLRAYARNEEGEMQSGNNSFTVNAGAKLNAWSATHASWACSRTNDAVSTTVFVKRLPVQTGDFVYTKKTCEAGDEYRFYRGLAWDGQWIKTKGDGSVEYVGICGGSYPPDDPAMIRWVADTFKLYESDLESGCLYAGGGNSSPVTLYRNIYNDKYYSSAAAAQEGKDYNYALDGYYWTFVGQNSAYRIITSGVITGSGVCS
ncbi:hypothetical protein [Pedobacter cryoconitis]|uniref:Uncharacterized protein n=1 Tax=Pedobacter cryoconitis TaxID=188932 RepID=A0A327SMV9_9SPHI|nr:hypothetical protein [Pedobacter cryoconitis]RAJ28863.1 hypothetical protein LY11_03137 [Pedobacter cryoconitis]